LLDSSAGWAETLGYRLISSGPDMFPISLAGCGSMWQSRSATFKGKDVQGRDVNKLVV